MISKLLQAATLVVGLLIGNSAFALTCVRDTGDIVLIEDGARSFHVSTVANYIAHIGERDLFNSAGVRLTSFAAILQQDRANLHKTGRNDGGGAFADGWDDHFKTLARRSEISVAHFFTDCWMSAADTRDLKNGILNGNGGGLWVLAFYLPDGKLGMYISGVS